MMSFDSRWSIHTGLSILHEGNTNLDEYEKEIIVDGYKSIETIDGHYYTTNPVGATILSLPFIALADAVFNFSIDKFPSLSLMIQAKLATYKVVVKEPRLIDIYPGVEMIIASFYCALAAAFMFLVCRLFLPKKHALIVVFIFAFCTSCWSTTSRALWQHGPSILMLLIAMYVLLKYEFHKSKNLHFIAIPLALAFIVRPTNAIPIFFISVYIFLYYRDYFIKYLLVSLPFAVMYFFYNYSIYTQLFSNYSQPDRVFHMKNFFEALGGNIYSPSRGLFIYSPIFLLSIFSFIRNKSSRYRPILMLFLLIIVSHWLLISSFPHWYGGRSYGPRLFADMIPFFMFPIVIWVKQFIDYPFAHQLRAMVLILPLLSFSFYVHYKGAYIKAVHDWNIAPTKIHDDTDRLWDWEDMQIFRN